MLDTVKVYTDCHVRGLVDYPAAVADFNAQRIEENDRVELISLAVLPDHDLIQDGVGNRRNRLMGTINPGRSCHMVLESLIVIPPAYKLMIISPNVSQTPRAFAGP